MKYHFLFLLLPFLGSGLSNLSAQPSYMVIETPKWLFDNQHNSYSVNIIGEDDYQVVYVWESKLEKAGGKKIKDIVNQNIINAEDFKANSLFPKTKK